MLNILVFLKFFFFFFGFGETKTKSLEITPNHSKSHQNCTKSRKITRSQHEIAQITKSHEIAQNVLTRHTSHKISLDVTRNAPKSQRNTQKHRRTCEIPSKQNYNMRNPHMSLKLHNIPECTNRDHTKSYAIT